MMTTVVTLQLKVAEKHQNAIKSETHLKHQFNGCKEWLTPFCTAELMVTRLYQSHPLNKKAWFFSVWKNGTNPIT